jgi:uncharacterized RDD family membrane protein YckC
VVGLVFGAVGPDRLFFSGAASFAVGLAYQWFFLTRNNGQTIGKMLLNLRVVKADGSEFTDATAVLRFFGYYINSALIMLGWLIAFVDPNRQGLHDKLAGTYVIKVRK